MTSAATAAADVVRDLAQATQAVHLYPSRHPDRLRACREVVSSVHHLRERAPQDPTLFVDRHAFYLGTTLLAAESLRFYRLADEFEGAGVESLTFEFHVQPEDVERLVEVLVGHRPRESHVGGIGINRVRPTRLAETAWQERLRELRRAYAAALDAVRDASGKAEGGAQIDLEAAHAVVSRLADEVGRDPGYGLLLSAIKSHDEYTYHHMVNVCVLSVALAQLIGLHRDQVIALGVGGLLHDIGKVAVPLEILRSVGPLSEEEWRVVQQHPMIGTGLLFATGAGLYHPAASVVLEHHVAYDASGYPPVDHELPSLPARLVAVADCFDAVTTKRSYREALDRDDALEILVAGSGGGFDPRAVSAFRRLVGPHPVGSLVRLDSGDIGLVVRTTDVGDPRRPTVLVLLDADGSPVDGEERDLRSRRRDGVFRWSVREVVSADDVGIDLAALVASGTLTGLSYARMRGGLVHEPAPGEPPPHGYVDTHAHDHAHEQPGGRADPDVAPPFDGSDRA